MTSEFPEASSSRKSLSKTITEALSLAFPRKARDAVVALDRTPTGKEEEGNLFGDRPVDEPSDPNANLDRAERLQDMGERKKFADNAFDVTYKWVWFLMALPVLQMVFSIWDKGLTDGQFIAGCRDNDRGSVGVLAFGRAIPVLAHKQKLNFSPVLADPWPRLFQCDFRGIYRSVGPASPPPRDGSGIRRARGSVACIPHSRAGS